jgi:type IV pilus assembly protein PilW
MAGFIGCQVNSIGNSVNDTSGDWKFDFSNSVLGYEGGVDSFPAEVPANVVAGSDAIVISRGNDAGFYIEDHVPTAATIHTTETNDLKQGEILMIVDCLAMQGGIFQRSDTNQNDTSSQVNHATGASVSPGNCTKNLGGNFDCSDTTSAVEYKYSDDSKLLRMRNTIFYIATSRNNRRGEAIPSLFHEYVTNNGSGGTTTVAEELVEGIENFQILYGIDTDATADGVANRYVTANSVTSWDKVASVRLFVLARSIDPVGNDPRQFTFMGTKSTSTDGYVRKQFTATIQVRNHGLGL